MPTWLEANVNRESAARVCAVLVLATIVGGCATVYEGKYDYANGWRSGLILKIGTEADLATFGAPCHSREQASTARFAYVQFGWGATHGKYLNSEPRQRHLIVPLSPGEDVREGQRVYVNIQDCGQFAAPASK